MCVSARSRDGGVLGARTRLTHVEDGDDGRVVSADDGGDVLGLWNLGGDQLEENEENVSEEPAGGLRRHVPHRWAHHDFRRDEVFSFAGHTLHLPLLLPIYGVINTSFVQGSTGGLEVSTWNKAERSSGRGVRDVGEEQEHRFQSTNIWWETPVTDRSVHKNRKAEEQ